MRAVAKQKVAFKLNQPPPPSALPHSRSRLEGEDTRTTSSDLYSERLSWHAAEVTRPISFRKRMSLTIRQQVAARPGCLYSNEPRELSFKAGALFSFPLHSTLYDEDAAQIRIPKNLKLTINTASVDRRQMADFLKIGIVHGVTLKISSEENGALLPIWTFDKERSSEHCHTGFGLNIEGPRIIRLAAVTDKGFKKGTPLDVNLFGFVSKGG